MGMKIINRSWEITKASLRMLRDRPKVQALMLTWGAAMTVLFATLSSVLLRMSDHQHHVNAHGVPFTRWVVLYAVMMGLVFFIMFCNVAFTHGVMRSLRDEPVSVRASLRFALSRLPAILGFTLLGTTVGVLIGTLERYTANLGGWVTQMIFGASWSAATFLAIPVLVQERRSPIGTVRRSAGLFKQTWGETFFGQLSLGLIAGLPLAGAMGLFMTGIHYLPTHLLLAIAACIVALPLMVVLGGIASAVRSIYGVALYQYAVEGVRPSEFDTRALDDVFVAR
jgi:hypothetical protein